MKYFTPCFLSLLTVLTILGCGDSEQDLKPTTPVVDTEIPDNYFEYSELLYEPTLEQIEELLNLTYPEYWYREEDPELHAKYYYAMLLQKYGDIPAVHVDAQFYRLHLLSNGIPKTFQFVIPSTFNRSSLELKRLYHKLPVCDSQYF